MRVRVRVRVRLRVRVRMRVDIHRVALPWSKPVDLLHIRERKRLCRSHREASHDARSRHDHREVPNLRREREAGVRDGEEKAREHPK